MCPASVSFSANPLACRRTGAKLSWHPPGIRPGAAGEINGSPAPAFRRPRAKGTGSGARMAEPVRGLTGWETCLQDSATGCKRHSGPRPPSQSPATCIQGFWPAENLGRTGRTPRECMHSTEIGGLITAVMGGTPNGRAKCYRCNHNKLREKRKSVAGRRCSGGRRCLPRPT